VAAVEAAQTPGANFLDSGEGEGGGVIPAPRPSNYPLGEIVVLRTPCSRSNIHQEEQETSLGCSMIDSNLERRGP